MNWTPVLVALITLQAVFFEEVLRRYVVPWLKENNLMSVAKYAVQAAEAIYVRGHGSDKLKEALEIMKNKGFNINTSEVMNALQAAWKQLDIDQIAAGIKEPAE